MAAPFKMASLAKGKESLDSKPGKITSSPYSYEHRITLDQNALDKLGVDVPSVGITSTSWATQKCSTYPKAMARAERTSASSSN